MQRPRLKLVDTLREVINGSDEYCRCPKPATDMDAGLDSWKTDWCWLCRKPIDPTSLRDRIVAFIA